MPLVLLAIGAIVVVAAVIALGNPFGGASPSASPGLAVGDGTCPTEQPAPLPAGEPHGHDHDAGGRHRRRDRRRAVADRDGQLRGPRACHFYDGSVFHRPPPSRTERPS
jgi:hypothetical protein